jgi:amidase
MGYEELWWLDGCAQADLVARGELSPLELVDTAIARIERLNPVLNAVIHERFERARAEAAGELPAGPFRGVPLLLKDLGCPSAGDPMHNGSRFLKRLGWRSDHDSFLVAKLRRAGFVILGRTNTPELGSTITTEPLAYGPTHNPWSLAHSPGGSSGGSAAAVAAGLVPIAHGSDGGGSIRIPASACGLVGLKPTRHRVSKGPDVGDSWAGAAVDHVLTRSVRDSAAVLDCIAGYVPGDPSAAIPPARPFSSEVGVSPGRLKIGVLDHRPGSSEPGHPDCVAAVAEAGRLLEGLGHALEPAYPEGFGDEELMGNFVTMVAAWTAADLDAFAAMTGESVPPEEIEADNIEFSRLGRALTAPQYLAAVAGLERGARRAAAFFSDEGFDLLLTPVLAGPPPPLGWLSDPLHGQERVLRLLAYTGQVNITGQPAISLPLSWNAEGLPIGIQLAAAVGREDLLIQVASALERVAPSTGRHPSL